MKNRFFCMAFVLLLGASGLANAGVYSDDLSRCLVESSTPQDKAALVKWMFTSMALHPDISSMSKVTDEQRDAANKNVADSFVKLMTKTCLEQAQKAIKYEGPVALQHGFSVFGQVAGQELFTHPDVAQALSGLEEHIDEQAIEDNLGVQP